MTLYRVSTGAGAALILANSNEEARKKCNAMFKGDTFVAPDQASTLAQSIERMAELDEQIGWVP